MYLIWKYSIIASNCQRCCPSVRSELKWCFIQKVNVLNWSLLLKKLTYSNWNSIKKSKAKESNEMIIHPFNSWPLRYCDRHILSPTITLLTRRLEVKVQRSATAVWTAILADKKAAGLDKTLCCGGSESFTTSTLFWLRILQDWSHLPADWLGYQNIFNLPFWPHCVFSVSIYASLVPLGEETQWLPTTLCVPGGGGGSPGALWKDRVAHLNYKTESFTFLC